MSNLNLTYCSRPLKRLAKSIHTSLKAVNHPQHDDSKMQAWQIHSYGGLEEVQLSKFSRIPALTNPKDVLVQVSSASVNSIDLAMMGGYGSVLLNAMRQLESCSVSAPLEFPLTLGRDFCGCVLSTGMAVRNVKKGDLVWGTIPPHQQGCHAQKVIVNEAMTHRKPTALNDIEAGSMLYAGLTAWSALKISSGLYFSPASSKRVLVLGGSGGVGLMAIQLLKAWRSQVVSTCRTDAMPLLESFGVDCVIDYTQPDADKLIRAEGKYDIILDCAGLGSDAAGTYADSLKDWSFSKFVTLKSPMLRNIDNYGLAGGMIKNAVDLTVPNLKVLQASKSSTVRWGFFIPLPEAIKEITSLVEHGKLCPTVEKVFPFEELPAAYERVKQGHLRGKIVIAMEDYRKTSAN